MPNTPSSHLDLIHNLIASRNRSFVLIGRPEDWIDLEIFRYELGYALVQLDFENFSSLGTLYENQFACYFSEQFAIQLSHLSISPLSVDAVKKHPLHHLSKWLENCMQNLPEDTRVILSLDRYEVLCNLANTDVLAWIRGATSGYPNMIILYRVGSLPNQFAEYVKDAQAILHSDY